MRLLLGFFAPDWMVMHHNAQLQRETFGSSQFEMRTSSIMFLMYNDQHQHYQISFLFRTPQAREWDDSHVPGSCHRGSTARRLALSVRRYCTTQGLTTQDRPSRKLSARTCRSCLLGSRLVTKSSRQTFVGEMAKEAQAGGRCRVMTSGRTGTKPVRWVTKPRSVPPPSERWEGF